MRRASHDDPIDPSDDADGEDHPVVHLSDLELATQILKAMSAGREAMAQERERISISPRPASHQKQG
jgi:hypothetical protein